MRAYGITDDTKERRFSEQQLEVPIEMLRHWLYEPVAVDALPVLPFCKMADALGTNAEWIIGLSDDPRPAQKLTYFEDTLIQSVRAIGEEWQRTRILRLAQCYAGMSDAAPHVMNPFPGPPPRKEPGGSSRH